MRARPTLVVSLVGLLAGVPPAIASEPSRGERLALEGRCVAALPELERRLEAHPGDARVAWRLGQCALREQAYPRAVAALEQALDANPGLLHARLDLARAYFHLGDLEAAEGALREASALDGEALWQLYRGMLAWARGDPVKSAEALERARAIDAASVDPVASFYLGLALRELGRDDASDDALDAVVRSAPGSVWAEEADRARTSTLPEARGWLEWGVGAEYDDNVVLVGRDAPLPADISDEEDVRAVWQARLGVEGGTRDDTAFGAIASYRGRAHSDGDLRDFDTHFPGLSLWLQQALTDATALRFDYDLRYLWVDAEPFVWSNAGRVSLRHAWSPDHFSAVHGSLFHDDYLFRVTDVPDQVGATCGAAPLPPPFAVCGPPGLDERRERDRDGWGLGAGASHAWRVRWEGLPEFTLRGGYAFARFAAEGREYSHDAHRGFAGLGLPMPGLPRLGLDVEASYTHRPYRHASTFPDPRHLSAGQPYSLSRIRRREDVVGVVTQLRISLAERLSATAYYRVRDHRSTAEVFDYDQHVVGFRIDAALEVF